MIGAVLAPLAMAHGDTGAHNTLVSLTTLKGGARPGEGAALGTGGFETPAGWYYGSVSAWAQLNAFAVGPGTPVVPSPPCPNPTNVAQVDTILCSLVASVDPSFTLAAADALCDMEVAGLGGGDAVDEAYVDNSAAGAGSAPDGTFNDGGVGAACNTHAGFYSLGAYNTDGCPASKTASASDLVSAGGVWLSATCDYEQPVSTDPLLTQVLSAETCAANSALTGNVPGGTISCVEHLTACTLGVPNPPGCPSTAATTCVPDGVADGVSGNGVGNKVGGVPYPAQSAACATAGGASAEAAFVWNSVQATTTGGVPTLDVLSTAVYGWVQ